MIGKLETTLTLYEGGNLLENIAIVPESVKTKGKHIQSILLQMRVLLIDA